jgi:biopolymer transport protein ExbB/TolQ
VRAELKRGVSGLAIIGAAAPFVGLLGTVVEVINSFKGILTVGNATRVGSVAGSILEALITAAVGLLVAIPALWMFTHLTRKVDVFDGEMRNSSNELLDQLLEHSQKWRNPHLKADLAGRKVSIPASGARRGIRPICRENR